MNKLFTTAAYVAWVVGTVGELVAGVGAQFAHREHILRNARRDALVEHVVDAAEFGLCGQLRGLGVAAGLRGTLLLLLQLRQLPVVGDDAAL